MTDLERELLAADLGVPPPLRRGTGTVILPAEKLPMPGKYWARVPGRTDWFIMDIKRPEQIREQDQMAGFEFKPILPPR